MKNKITILIAEDEYINFLLLEELLSDFDFGIIHAKNGKEAVSLFQANEDIALILMDIKMPIMDGITAAQNIKALRPDIPIIAQSAFINANEDALTNENIFNNYISKPINEKRLKEVVKQYI